MRSYSRVNELLSFYYKKWKNDSSITSFPIEQY